MSQIPRNSPCPCGSGKKYKRCCENKPVPFARKKEKITLNFDVLEYFRRFNFSELLLWLQTILCHPANQRYVHRLEFLIAQLFAIPLNEFKGGVVERSDLVQLLVNTKKAYDELFYIYEDFDGYPQLQLIPLFFGGQRYYFFYADLERPYEDYQNFIDRYFDRAMDDWQGREELKTIFSASLSFQTKVLLKIKDVAGKIKAGSGVFVPEKSFFDAVCDLFKEELSCKDIIVKYQIDAGAFSKKFLQQILDESVALNLFNQKLFVRIDETVFWIYPHIHLKTMMDIGRGQVEKRNLLPVLQDHLHMRLIDYCDQVFTIFETVFKLEADGKRLDVPIEHLVFTDRNKLLLFKVARYSLHTDISNELTEV